MPIKNLNGRQPGKYLLFGMLTYMKDGLFLEDPDASIALDFAKNVRFFSYYRTMAHTCCEQKMERGPGLFTPNCFVLAHGEYTEEKRFVVQVLGMPPPESRTKSL